MGQFCQSVFDRVVCPPHVRILFPDDNLSNYQWIFTKLGTCIDIEEIWFWITNGQISPILCRIICPQHDRVAGYYRFTFLFCKVKTIQSGLNILCAGVLMICKDLKTYFCP